MMLERRIGGWLGSRFGTPRGSRRPRPLALRPGLDVLEGRELKDGGISLVAGTITIEATAARNSAVVSYTDPSHATVAVNWNNTVADFNRADVTGIQFDGQGSVNLFDNFTDISSTAHGGDGINYFLGESGNDAFTGGDGLNVFWVTGGDDTLVGGNGTNVFLGVGGKDSVTVGNGFNTIIRS